MMTDEYLIERQDSREGTPIQPALDCDDISINDNAAFSQRIQDYKGNRSGNQSDGNLFVIESNEASDGKSNSPMGFISFEELIVALEQGLLKWQEITFSPEVVKLALEGIPNPRPTN